MRSLVYKNKTLLLMLLPAVIYFFIFSYLPMAGTVIAFKNFNYRGGIFGSPWSGFDNFKFFFQSGDAFRVTKNTIFYNAAFIIINNFLQVTFAIIIAELAGKLLKRILQSVILLPYFISWVIVGAFVYNLANFDYGIINTFLKSWGILPIDIYGNASWWKYIIVFVSAWKWVGYGVVLYLASIMSISAEMFEAARIDGANIFQEIRHITLPSITPQLIVLILLQIGRLFRGDFEMFYQLVGNNGLLFGSTDVIDVYVFRSLTQLRDFGMAAASGFYQSVLCFVVIMVTNYSIKRYKPDYSLF